MELLVLILSLFIEIVSVCASAVTSKLYDIEFKNDTNIKNRKIEEFKSLLVVSREELDSFYNRFRHDIKFQDIVLNYYYSVIEELGLDINFYKYEDVKYGVAPEIYLIGQLKFPEDTVDNFLGNGVFSSDRFIRRICNPYNDFKKMTQDDIEPFYQWISYKVNSKYKDFYVVKFKHGNSDIEQYGWNIDVSKRDTVVKEYYHSEN